jgi:hypothetical protein
MVTIAIIIIAIVAVIGVYYLTLPLAPIEIPPKILSHTWYIQNDTVRYFTVVGEVKNNLNTAIESVQINATFYDANNDTIDTTHTYIEKSIVSAILPGQKAPFTIKLVLNSLPTIPARYHLVLSYAKATDKTYAEFVTLNRTSFDNNGYYVISGWIQDVTLGKVVGARVICTYYDQNSNVMGVSSNYLPSWMYSGDKAQFRVSSEPRKLSPASYEILVTAVRYEPPLTERIELLIILIAAFIIIVAYMKHRGW